MALTVLKIFTIVSLILTSSWVARRNPGLGGFILALPMTTLIALAWNFIEYRDAPATIEFARSTFFAIPLSLLFFVPFLLHRHLGWGFWPLYASGIVLLGVGYLVHQRIYAA